MTKKVKTFWYVLKNSLLPQKKYYQHIPHARFSFSIKYLFILTLILNLLLLIYLGLEYNPNKLKSLFSQVSKSLNKYPDDLSIMINNGHLRTTYDRPFFLWLNLKNKVIPLLVIDETARETKINQYKSIFLLTSNNLVYRQPQLLSSNLKKLPLKIIPTCFINKGIINKTTISKLQNILDMGSSYVYLWFISFIALSIIILPTTFFLLLLFFLFFLSMIFYLITRLFISKASFTDIFQLSFHSTTLPLLLAYVLNYKTINFSFFSPSILFLVSVFLFGAVYERYRNPLKLKKHKKPSIRHHFKKNHS